MGKRMGPEPVAQNKLDAAGIDAICTEIAECVTFRQIAKKYDVSLGVLSGWLAKHPEQYARSQEIRADAMSDDMLSIADDGVNDTYMDADGKPRTDHDVIARSRLRVDTRKWLASKMFPKRYGEKLQTELSGPDGGPQEHVVNLRPKMTIEEWAQSHGLGTTVRPTE